MNLYMCWVKESEYVVFVFAVNPNQAKRITCEWETETLGHYDAIYDDICFSFEGKTDKVLVPTLVDTERHPLYPIIEELGAGYAVPPDWMIE